MTTAGTGREVDIAEFCAAPAEILNLVTAGEAVILLRDSVPVATLQGLTGDGALMTREAATTYVPRPVATQVSPVSATALVRLLGGESIRSALAVFLREPEREIHQREIARRAGIGLRSAQIALGRLVSLGLIESRRDGNRLYYSAVRGDRFEDLRRLLGREVGIPEVLTRSLMSLSGRINWAFVYGSVATGTDRVDSDVDVLVVGDVSEDELVQRIAAAQRELGREVDVMVLRPGEYSRRLKSNNHFLLATLDAPRIDLIGGPDDA